MMIRTWYTQREWDRPVDPEEEEDDDEQENRSVDEDTVV